MSDEHEISVRAFLHDLRVMLPLSVGAMLLLALLDVGGDVTVIEALLFGVAFNVVLGPLLWGWWERAIYTQHAKDPALWRFFGWSVLWAVFSSVVILSILHALDI